MTVDLIEFGSYLSKVAGMSNNTVRAYISQITKFTDWLGKHPLDATVQDILEYMEWLYDKKYSQQTQVSALSALRALYDFYMTKGVIDYNPARMIKRRFRTGSKLPDVLTIQEIEKIVFAPYKYRHEEYEQLRDASVLATLACTGIRVSELCNLKPENYNPDNTIKVFGKGRKERIVPIITRWFSRPDEMLYLVKHYIGNVSRKMYPRKVCYITHHASKYAIGRRVNPHVFRHSFATQLIRDGLDITTVQQIMGHTSIVTTQKYVHLAFTDVMQKLREKGLFT